MSYRSVTFPVTLGRDVDPIILDSRMAVTDVLRKFAEDQSARAEVAGIDAMSAGQRQVMTFMNATRASKFIRAFPAAIARWAFVTKQMHVQHGAEGYPEALPQTVAGQGYRWLQVLSNGVILVNAGGVRATGTAPADTPIVMHEVREVRLTKNVDGGYDCTVVMSSYSAPRDDAAVPADDEPVLENEDL